MAASALERQLRASSVAKKRKQGAGSKAAKEPSAVPSKAVPSKAAKEPSAVPSKAAQSLAPARSPERSSTQIFYKVYADGDAAKTASLPGGCSLGGTPCVVRDGQEPEVQSARRWQPGLQRCGTKRKMNKLVALENRQLRVQTSHTEPARKRQCCGPAGSLVSMSKHSPSGAAHVATAPSTAKEDALSSCSFLQPVHPRKRQRSLTAHSCDTDAPSHELRAGSALAMPARKRCRHADGIAHGDTPAADALHSLDSAHSAGGVTKVSARLDSDCHAGAATEGAAAVVAQAQCFSREHHYLRGEGLRDPEVRAWALRTGVGAFRAFSNDMTARMRPLKLLWPYRRRKAEEWQARALAVQTASAAMLLNAEEEGTGCSAVLGAAIATDEAAVLPPAAPSAAGVLLRLQAQALLREPAVEAALGTRRAAAVHCLPARLRCHGASMQAHYPRPIVLARTCI